MFARIKKSGPYQYVQIVESRREGKKVRQRVIATVGRLDKLNAKGELENLARSLVRFSEQAVLVLSSKSKLRAEGKKIGPALIFSRLWEQLGFPKVIDELLRDRLFGFDVERAIFTAVLHRLMISGSDRSCWKWKRDHVISGAEDLELHQLYRAMAFLGEEIEDQDRATPFAPRCTKDLIEESFFRGQRHMFTGLDLVFFDTTSLCFEGRGGENLGRRGFSKDHRPDLNQMVLGAVLDRHGRPICCEMWPGNTADVKSLIPVARRIRHRFQVARFCLVADRGMVSEKTLEILNDPQTGLDYILGVRMRNCKEVQQDVLSRAGRYHEVPTDGQSPLKVKEVWVDNKRYIICLNPKQARKDKADREAILEALEEQLRKDAKNLVGNRGYRKFLKSRGSAFSIDHDKVRREERFDGKWVLITNTTLPAEQVALKYKELWRVERLFRETKSLLATRPIYHRLDETIRGHVFCSFLALVLKKELYQRLEAAGRNLEWEDIKQDLEALREVIIEQDGKRFAVRTECQSVCGKVFQSVGVAVPPTIRQLEAT